jgi:DNA replication protein DnaC
MYKYVKEMEFVEAGSEPCPKCGSPITIFESKEIVKFLGRKIIVYADHYCKEHKRTVDPEISKIIKDIEFGNRLKRSNLPNNQKLKNTFTFPFSKNNTVKNKQLLVMDKVRWSIENPDNFSGLLLWGGVGAGKTETAKIIGMQLIKNGYNVIYNHTSQFIDHFKYGIKELNVKKDDIYKWYLKNYDCIIIDEFGEEGSYYDLVLITNMINLCYERGKKIILTSNINFDKLNKNKIDSDKDKLIYKIWDRFHDESVNWFHLPFSWESLRRI